MAFFAYFQLKMEMSQVDEKLIMFKNYYKLETKDLQDVYLTDMMKVTDPARYRPKKIRFNLCVLMHGVHNGTNPSYLMDSTPPISSLKGHRRLYFAMTTEYDIPRTRTKFGDRAFSVAGPCEWNALPADIRMLFPPI